MTAIAPSTSTESEPVRRDVGKLKRRSIFSRRRLPTVLVTLFMLILALYFLLPLIWLFVASTKSTSDLFNTNAFAFADFQLFDNIAQLGTYDDGRYWLWYGNSVLYSGGTAIGSTLVCTLAAYALAKFRFRGQRVIASSIIGSLVVPVPTFLLLTQVGLVNTHAGVILPGIPSAFGAYFLLTYIRETMPDELIDAGRIDGAGEWQIFFRVSLPIIRPGVVTYLLIAFISSWNNFFLPLLILNDPAKFPVTLGLSNWLSLTTAASAIGTPPYEQLITGALLSILPMVIIFPLFRKQIAAGMAAGSVK
jgi:multiple sugar transport system permease protein